MLSEGFEPPTTGSKPVMISVSPREHTITMPLNNPLSPSSNFAKLYQIFLYNKAINRLEFPSAQFFTIAQNCGSPGNPNDSIFRRRSKSVSGRASFDFSAEKSSVRRSIPTTHLYNNLKRRTKVQRFKLWIAWESNPEPYA